MLIGRKITVAVAESCTGGLLSKMLTDPPGSSAYFLLGVTAYANSAKTRVLGIPGALIREKGAVSKDAAVAMARRIRRLAGADIGIGTTGIAGPSGGTSRKPVGTVYIALADAKGAMAKKLSLRGSRQMIRARAAKEALALLSQQLTATRKRDR